MDPAEMGRGGSEGDGGRRRGSRGDDASGSGGGTGAAAAVPPCVKSLTSFRVISTRSFIITSLIYPFYTNFYFYFILFFNRV